MDSDFLRKSPMSRRGRNELWAEETLKNLKSQSSSESTIPNFSEQLQEIKTSLMHLASPSSDNNYADRRWMEDAKCTGQTVKFFRHSCSPRCDNHTNGCNRVKSVRECRAICLSCPVLNECRNWSIYMNLTHGFAGGLTEGERSKIRIEILGEDDDERE